MRILLVEDDLTIARSIELMLTQANYNVYRTDMGEEGIDLAKLYDYDLILLDLDLPDMNGMEVLRQIRLSRVDTPILILTGSDDTEIKLRGLASIVERSSVRLSISTRPLGKLWWNITGPPSQRHTLPRSSQDRPAVRGTRVQRAPRRASRRTGRSRETRRQ